MTPYTSPIVAEAFSRTLKKLASSPLLMGWNQNPLSSTQKPDWVNAPRDMDYPFHLGEQARLGRASAAGYGADEVIGRKHEGRYDPPIPHRAGQARRLGLIPENPTTPKDIRFEDALNLYDDLRYWRHPGQAEKGLRVRGFDDREIARIRKMIRKGQIQANAAPGYLHSHV